MTNSLLASSAFSIGLACILIVLALLAAVLEWACLRERQIPDNELSVISRRLMIAGWLLYSGRLVWLLGSGHAGNVHPLALIAFCLIALSCVLRCANRLNLIGHMREQPPYPISSSRKVHR